MEDRNPDHRHAVDAQTTPRATSTPTASTSPSGTPSAQQLLDRGEGNANTNASVKSSTPPAPIRKTASASLVPIASPPTGTSPRGSRHTSPQRRDANKPHPLSTTISTQPSAAAIQRALSAANVPSLQQQSPAADAASKQPGHKSANASGENTPQWPISPRLRSPPPSGATARQGSGVSQKRSDSNNPIPNINLDCTTTPPPKAQSAREATGRTESPSPSQSQTSTRTQSLSQASKPPARGPSGRSTLETVRETSSDSIPEPAAATRAATDLRPLTRFSDDNASITTDGAAEDKARVGESGSDSGGNKIEKRHNQAASKSSGVAPPSRPGYSSLASAKSRKPEGTRNMTVETETVQSIPQSGLNTGDRSGVRGESSLSLKLKPSNETIRPKKERRKVMQKPRSVNQGTGTPHVYRSPLLLPRSSFESIGEQSSSAASAAEADDVASGHTSPQIRAFSLSQQAQRVYSTFRPQAFDHLRAQSDNHPRKASSKADIFEARVADAVDAANSSDSDETFVYESNPPEPQRPPRHHSRTPSVTSSNSVADPQRSSVRGYDMEERRVAGKRSMKFSSNHYSEADGATEQNGSVRTHHPRHIGKFGQRGTHASMYDPDSPFTQAQRLRTSALGSRHSRPNSPRSPQSAQQQSQQPQRQGGLFDRKAEPTFDFDGHGADDEQTPLMGTVRTPRSGRYPRRINSVGGDRIDSYYGLRRTSRCGGRWGGCLLGCFVFLVVVLSAIGFLIMSNRPMHDVRVKKIQNVLASEQELMLDILVAAVNPNALSITIADMDVNIFAKSSHIGDGKHSDSDALEHDHSRLTLSPSVATRRGTGRPTKQQRSTVEGGPNGWQDLTGHWHPPGNVDDGTDPMPPGHGDEDLEGDAQTMLLGRIFHFDQPLVFEGSPIKRHAHYSLGELRLPKPGNKTEAGGSQRWEKVLQYPFELIVRGVLKYQLPISSRTQSAAVGARVLVHPEDGVDNAGNMRLEKIHDEEHWQWIDWDDVADYDGGEEVVEDVGG